MRGQPSWFVCDREEVVIGPANHGYNWVTCTKERCTAMVLRKSSPMLKRGSRKGGCTRGVVFGTSQERVMLINAWGDV